MDSDLIKRTHRCLKGQILWLYVWKEQAVEWLLSEEWKLHQKNIWKTSDRHLSGCYFPEPPASCSVGTQSGLSTVPRGSRGNKSADDLMQDEKRHHPFFTIPHGIYFLSTLIILRSIKACSRSRCILPRADSTCKHFLSRSRLPSPEAKHDYPILMRFLMFFFYPSKTILLSPTLCG